MAEYIEIEEAIKMPGLRVVLPPRIPGPWGEAIKGVLHVKKIPYTKVRHDLVEQAPLIRCGFPPQSPPLPLERVWNLDAIKADPSDYRRVGRNVRNLYLTAYPEVASKVSTPEDTDTFVDEFVKEHPRMSNIGTWRALVAALVRRMDSESSGIKPPSTAELHGSIMDELARE